MGFYIFSSHNSVITCLLQFLLKSQHHKSQERLLVVIIICKYVPSSANIGLKTLVLRKQNKSCNKCVTNVFVPRMGQQPLETLQSLQGHRLHINLVCVYDDNDD